MYILLYLLIALPLWALLVLQIRFKLQKEPTYYHRTIDQVKKGFQDEEQ